MKKSEKVTETKTIKTTKKVTEIKTTQKGLQELTAIKAEADKAFFKYRALYNKQHNVEVGTMIREIIDLHISGCDNKEIIEKGYNKNTVNRQVFLYKKGIKKETTIVNKFLLVDKDAKDVEMDETES